MKPGAFHRSLDDVEPDSTGWGEIAWLVDNTVLPGAEQTFGLVRIHPGRQNPLHLHPNCEELLYVVSGQCDHRLGEQVLQLRPGSLVRIPAEVAHQARCTSEEPLVAVISFSSGDRQTVTLEGDAVA